MVTLLQWGLIVGSVLVGIGYGWIAARTAQETDVRRWARIGIGVLALWGCGALGLVLGPIFQRPWESPIGLAMLPLTIGLATGLGLMALAYPPHRRLVAQMPLAAVIGLHGLRIVLGAILLIGAFTGLLPQEFGIEAGIGDIIVGALALRVAQLVRREVPGALRWVVLWNIAGLLDLTNALRLGIGLVFPYFVAQQLPAWIGALPAFGVPLYLIWHAQIFWLAPRHTRPAIPGRGVNR